jgi:hypothetical protein
MSQSKKGMSALQIHRQIGSGDYRTAWYLCQRIRAAMKDSTFAKLMGELEVDEPSLAARIRIATGKRKPMWAGRVAERSQLLARFPARAISCVK